jgi:hypothetical protein
VRVKKLLLTVALLLAVPSVPAQTDDGTALAPVFQREVDRRLDIPPEARKRYAQLLETALSGAETPFMNSQYLLVLDRNPYVQAIFLYWLDLRAYPAEFHFIGAAPVSTGKPGAYDYFITPTGVFAHTLANKDYRAEGTRSKLGICGFGRKGMRVYDFGWVQGERGWGSGGMGRMRLLMHATDPDYLEPHLGEAMSKGCIRIPATLDDFIDRYGILDADYEQALAEGRMLWVLRADRTPTPWSGRYLVIVDSGSTERPLWAPAQATAARQP